MTQASVLRLRALGRPLPVVAAGAVLLLAALAFASLTPPLHGQVWASLGLLLVAGSVAAGTLMEFRWFSLTPSKAVLVAALLLLPLSLVPIVMIVGQIVPVLLHRRPDLVRSAATQIVLASPVLGTVLLLTVVGVDPASGMLAPWWWYVGALALQFGVESALRWTVDRQRLPRGRRLWAVAGQTLGIDLLLVMIGVGAAVAAEVHWSFLLFLLAPVVLVAVLTADQRGLGREVSLARTEARIDPLTGLGNRRAWLEAIEAVSRVRPDRRAPIGVVMADLDNLKFANDTLGHPVGDELITAVGAACAEAAPAGSIVCRIGGDEFAVLIRDAVGDRTGIEVAARLRELVAARGHIHGVLLSAGVGAADSPPEGSVEAAVELADAMVLAEKRRHRPAMPRQRSRAVLISRMADDSEPTVKLPEDLPLQRRRR